jgi:UDP:flavonoid glycosyltransferase YjiC (YdhE family)
MERKTILVCPLEWGLGHAGRMIPVIRKLIAMNQNVLIASGDTHREFFEKEFPGLRFIRFPGFRIRYSGKLPQYLVIFLKTPLLVYHSVREHIAVKRLIRKNNIDIIISDSRIGLWNRDVKTVLVTHMLRIPHPRWIKFLENAGLPVTRIVLRKFSFCYVPDLPDEINVSGKLSHNITLPPNVRYTGVLSRYNTDGFTGDQRTQSYYCTVILSGPEPQKSMLGEKLIPVLKASGKPCVILEGRPGSETRATVRDNITFINHLSTGEMKKLILSSENIITRSGYTSLMELISLGKSALLIPTPGQPEQEYLAGLMSEKGWFRMITQPEITSKIDIESPKVTFPGKIMEESYRYLSLCLEELLEQKYNSTQGEKPRQKS